MLNKLVGTLGKAKYGLRSFSSNTRVTILDTTARDAHQSLVNSQGIDYKFGIKAAQHATRIHRISLSNNGAGLRGLEAGGGMMPDACARTLGLNYWWWFNQVAGQLPEDLPIQILLRSQSANGYRPFADDIIDANIRAHIDAAEGHKVRGRVFDALNSSSNSISTYEAAHKHGMEIEGVYCYNLNKDGGIDLAAAKSYIKSLLEMGAKGVGVKDMAGLMSPEHAYLLGRAIRTIVGSEMNLSCHTHMTSHMAPATYYAFIMGSISAGGGPVSIDGSISSFSGGPAQPALETLAMFLQTMDVISPNLQTADFSDYADDVKKMTAHLSDMILKTASISADPRVMISKSPGGAYGNLVAQLQKANLLHLKSFILNRIPIVKEKLGNIPLVTPTALHVTTQAAKDVMSYHAEAIKNGLSVKSNSYNDYLNSKLSSNISSLTEDANNIAMGLYGQAPSPIDNEVKKLAIKENISRVINNEKAELQPKLKKTIINSLVQLMLAIESKVNEGVINRDIYIQLKKGQLSTNEVVFLLRQINEFNSVEQVIEGNISVQTLPKLLQAGMLIIGRSADILEPEFDTVKQSLRNAQHDLGFSMPWGTQSQNALTAMMFGGLETPYPGITSVGLEFMKNHGDARNFPNSAEMLREKSEKVVTPKPTSTEVTAVKDKNPIDDNKNSVLCKMPGTFYLKPSPSEPAYVEDGQWVDEGQVIGTTEAMKMFNKIQAPKSGYIKVLANEGDNVDSDQALFTINGNKEV